MEHLTTLHEALVDVVKLPWEAKLFLPMGERWHLETRCAILAVDPDADDDVEPPYAKRNGLSYALGIAQVQDIVMNAQAQLSNATAKQLLAAFLFYYDRDAFIVFANEDESECI